MKPGKRTLLRWLIVAGAAGALVGGVATAMPPQCWYCEPCGCASDGGEIMCCTAGSCR